MSRLNAKWHAEHRMPQRATPEQRITSHQEHQLQCACRPIPKGVLALIAARREGAPNPSLERTRKGRPASAASSLSAPAGLPLRAAQLKR